MTRNLSIAVIGAGAIGGVTAGILARVGYHIELVCKYPELALRIANQGIHVMGKQGDFQVKIPTVAQVSELSSKKDIIFLAVKATDMIPVVKELLPFLHDESKVVAMENGITEDTISEIVGEERTVGCIVGWGGTMHAPAEVEMSSTGEFVIGYLNHSSDGRLSQIKNIMEEILPCHISTNIMGTLYSKLIINACITSLGAISGQYLGKMLKTKFVRKLFLLIIRESIAVATAMKIQVEVYGGKLDYYKLIEKNTFLARRKQHLLIRIIGLKYRKLKSSSLQSLERGKLTEIDYLNGYITKNGKLNEIPTPINDKVVELIKEIEIGNRPISPENFKEFRKVLPKQKRIRTLK